MSNAWAFKLRGDAKSETLEIDIYDVVGDSWWSDSVSAKNVRALLKANKTASTIKLRINSEGGDVFDGWAIYNLLCEHPARVEADIDALAASAASVIAMAADEIRIASNAWVMIHNAWGGYRGEAEDLRRWADVLEKMSGQAADIYAARTGQTREKIVELMSAETWMTAAEAKALGFVDKVLPLKTATPGTKKAAASAFASMRLEDYGNAPEAVRLAVLAARLAARAQRDEESSRATSAEVDENNPSPEPGEGPSQQEQNPMNKKAMAKALGISESASDEAFEAAVVDMAATLAQVEGAVGAKGAGMLGALAAHVENSTKTLPKVTKERDEANDKLAKQEKAAEDAERETLLAAAMSTEATSEERPHAGKLTPAMAGLFRSKPIAELQGFLAVAARVVPAAVVQPTTTTTTPAAGAAAVPTGSSDVVAGQNAAGEMTLNGKTYAETKPAARVALKRANPELFNEWRSKALNAA